MVLNFYPFRTNAAVNFNQFLASVTISHPLKTPENQRFCGIFRGYKMGALARNELIHTFIL